VSIHHSVISAPSLTEKSVLVRENNKFVFKVAKKATKTEIKAAVEAIFGVEVVSINTMNVLGKIKRQGRFAGKRADWKKAIVELKHGQTIAQFGDM